MFLLALEADDLITRNSNAGAPPGQDRSGSATSESSGLWPSASPFFLSSTKRQNPSSTEDAAEDQEGASEMEDVAIDHEATRLAGEYQARQSQAAHSTATATHVDGTTHSDALSQSENLNVEADSGANEQIQGSKHDARTVSSDVSDGSES